MRPEPCSSPRSHSRSRIPVMRNPESTKNVSSDSTPPAVKYPACTEIANQIVKPRHPSSAGQYGRLVRLVVVGAGLSITVWRPLQRADA